MTLKFKIVDRASHREVQSILQHLETLDLTAKPTFPGVGHARLRRIYSVDAAESRLPELREALSSFANSIDFVEGPVERRPLRKAVR